MMGRKSIFDIKWFYKKLTRPDPIYLSRAEKEHILLIMAENKDAVKTTDTVTNDKDTKKVEQQAPKHENIYRSKHIHPRYTKKAIECVNLTIDTSRG